MTITIKKKDIEININHYENDVPKFITVSIEADDLEHAKEIKHQIWKNQQLRIGMHKDLLIIEALADKSLKHALRNHKKLSAIKEKIKDLDTHHNPLRDDIRKILEEK